MKFLLDTDHISVLQRESGAEYAALSARVSQYEPEDLAFSVVSFHAQTLGCHTYIVRARRTADLVRGYRMLARVIQDFSEVAVVPFDAMAASVFDDLVAQRIRIADFCFGVDALAAFQGVAVDDDGAGRDGGGGDGVGGECQAEAVGG